MTTREQTEPREPRNLRISYLLSQFPVPTQTFARSDISALCDEGHDVCVHTLKLPGNDMGAEDFAVFRPTLRGVLSWPALLWRMRSAVFQLIQRILPNIFASPATALAALACIPRAAEIVGEIEHRQADVVHLFWARHASLVLVLLEARGFKGVSSAFVGAYDLVADDFLVDMAMQSADLVFSHAEANRPFLQQRVPAGTAVEIIHRGIPLGDLEGSAVRDPNLWISASALVPAKNVDGVLRAFAHARSLRPQLVLQVFGEGLDLHRLEAVSQELGCAGAVQFMGHVSRQELFARMQAADTFIFLSKKPSERLPNVLKEALWAGCAVISSNSEGITELIPGETIGHVVDPNDDGAVFGAVRAVLERDLTLDQKRRETARALIDARFSAEANMRKYAAFWSDVASGTARVMPTMAAPGSE